MWQQIREQQQAFSSIGAFSVDTFNLATGGLVRYGRTMWVTGDFFHTLGVQPAAGRLISESDDQPGCTGGVTLSYAFWQQEYGGEDSAIGKQITLEGMPSQLSALQRPLSAAFPWAKRLTLRSPYAPSRSSAASSRA